MRVKKIILKNFIKPGQQTFVFDDDQKLIEGSFYDLKVLPLVNEIFNGKWEETINSFQKYYPNFRRKTPDMDLQMDALISLTDEELDSFNKLALQVSGVKQKSNNWYYSIKCHYPYIFPIVKLVPADYTTDLTFAIGKHFEKFSKASLGKSDLLNLNAVNSVGLIRDIYYTYKKMPVALNDLEVHKHYLEFFRSVFMYENDFIKVTTGLINQMDDGDVIRYGDQTDFFFKTKEFINFFNRYRIFRENKLILDDFKKVISSTMLRDIEWIYATKTLSKLIEIRKILWHAEGQRLIDTKDFFKIVKLNLKAEKYINRSIQQREFKDLKDDPILFSDNLKTINFFVKDYNDANVKIVVNKDDFQEFNVTKKSIRLNEKRIEEEKKQALKQRTVHKA